MAKSSLDKAYRRSREEGQGMKNDLKGLRSQNLVG